MRALVVEDQPEIREAVCMQLAASEVVVDAADTAQQALYKATTNQYSIILLDLNLPDGDGLTVCHELRQQSVRAPVLILSVRDEVEDKVRGFETGADDYLTKPYSPLELMARVNALVRRGTKQRTCIYKTRDLELQTRSRRVTLHGQTIDLTRREFDLLQYMLEHIDDVVTREELWECVWGWDDYPLHNTIEVHIARLREKLLDLKGKRIQTVRGVGYRLISEN